MIEKVRKRAINSHFWHFFSQNAKWGVSKRELGHFLEFLVRNLKLVKGNLLPLWYRMITKAAVFYCEKKSYFWAYVICFLSFGEWVALRLLCLRAPRRFGFIAFSLCLWSSFSWLLILTFSTFCFTRNYFICWVATNVLFILSSL